MTNQYILDELVPAQAVHAMTKERHGEHYLTAGYSLRLYRQRANLTQTQLAAQAGLRQHHLSEMEHNKRPLGKAVAKKLAAILNCDYQKLL